jgi:hypothetical protein
MLWKKQRFREDSKKTVKLANPIKTPDTHEISRAPIKTALLCIR